MKFETYFHKIVLDQQPNFHKDPCKDAHARDKNARTCDALKRFRSESTKIKKIRFSGIFEWTPNKIILITCQSGQNIMSLLKRNIQISPPLSTG